MDGYFSDMPARKDAFPNSERESLTVLRKMKKPDMEYFQLTDESPRNAFT